MIENNLKRGARHGISILVILVSLDHNFTDHVRTEDVLVIVCKYMYKWGLVYAGTYYKGSFRC